MDASALRLSVAHRRCGKRDRTGTLARHVASGNVVAAGQHRRLIVVHSDRELTLTDVGSAIGGLARDRVHTNGERSAGRRGTRHIAAAGHSRLRAAIVGCLWQRGGVSGCWHCCRRY